MPTVYTEALKILRGTSPEYGDGQPNDGAVVADALVTLERPRAVVPWVQDYRRRLEPMPGPERPITRDNWRAALGDMARVSDWVSFFQGELQQVPWPAVLRDWLPRLAPGMAGAAGHGLIRTAHAIHGLAGEEHDLCRGELAESLGYWAARFMKLPGILGSTKAGSLTPAQALSRIKWQHKQRPPEFDSISAGLRGLSGFPSFAGIINLVAFPDEPLKLISQITAALARVLLAHSRDPLKLIPCIHAIVVPGALRHLIPHLEREDACAALRYGWQFAGAMYTIYGRANPVETWPPPSEERDQLIDRAVATGDGAAVVFTEACLREYAVRPQPVYLAAAQEAVARLTPLPPDEPDETSQP